MRLVQLTVLLVACLLYSFGGADTTKMVPYQGMACVDGSSVDNISTVFSLVNSGNVVWTETITINIVDGWTNTFLGSVTPFPATLVNMNTNLMLNIKPSGLPVVQQEIRSTLFAHVAYRAQSMDSQGLTGTITANAQGIHVSGNIEADSLSIKGLSGIDIELDVRVRTSTSSDYQHMVFKKGILVDVYPVNIH